MVVTLGDWQDRTERDFKIRGRHSRNFYKHADELLRSETAPQVDGAKVQAARVALRRAVAEVEA